MNTSLFVPLALSLSLASMASAQVVVRTVDFQVTASPYTPEMVLADWGGNASILDGIRQGRARITTEKNGNGGSQGRVSRRTIWSGAERNTVQDVRSSGRGVLPSVSPQAPHGVQPREGR